MTFPLPKSLGWKIGIKLIEQGPMTHDQVLKAFDSRAANIRVSLSSLIDGNLIVQSGLTYTISDIFKAHINGVARAPVAQFVGEVVPPRVITIWDRPVLSGYDAAMRARVRA